MHEKKAVFLINSMSAGGAEKVLSVLTAELAAQGFQVELITFELNDFYKLDSRVKRTYLARLSGRHHGLIKILQLPILALKLKKYVRDNGISTVQSHVYRANYINILSKLFGSKHRVQVVNAGTISRYMNEGTNGKINLFLIKHLYKFADLIILKAKGMQNDMQRLFNFQNMQTVINNPYDIERLTKLSAEEAEDFGFRSDRKYIVSVGRLISLKRGEDLIKALKSMPQEFEIIFLGDGDQRDSLLTLTKESGLSDRVHFLGNVTNPFKYIAKSDYFVSCSSSEGFPNVLVEAMICGVPVISSDCQSGPREILAPSTDVDFQMKEGIELAEYGILFPVGGCESISNALKLLDESAELKEKYVEKGKQRAEDFSLKYIVSKYKEVMGLE